MGTGTRGNRRKAVSEGVSRWQKAGAKLYAGDGYLCGLPETESVKKELPRGDRAVSAEKSGSFRPKQSLVN